MQLVSFLIINHAVSSGLFKLGQTLTIHTQNFEEGESSSLDGLW